MGPRSPCDSRRRRPWRQQQRHHPTRRTRQGFSPAASRRERVRRRRQHHSPAPPARRRSSRRPCEGREEGESRPEREGEEAPLRSRRRCCRRCQVASGGEAVAAAANMFSVRIVTADYYMASPLRGLDICQSPLTQLPVKKVPVVRVFGATPAGKRERAGGSASGGAPGLPSPPPPRSRAHAGRRPSPGSLRTLPSSSLCSPFLPRVTGGAEKCGFVRALRPPPRQRGSGRRVRTVRAAGGLGPRLGGCASSPQGRVRGWVLRGRWLVGPRTPAAPP